jgi:transposase
VRAANAQGPPRQGKSDPIDAHLTVLTALQLDAGRLPTPRADGDREALRILLCARQELITTATAQTNRLRALLRDGDDQDLDLARARARFSDAVLAGLARRHQPRNASRAQAVRQGELRRLALALRDAGRVLKANRASLDAIVGELALGLTSRPGIGPVSAAQAIVSFSHAGRCRHEAAFARLARNQPDRGFQRPDHPAPAQPGRRQGAQPGHPVIAGTRMRCDPDTIAYVTRRRAQDKTDREIRRCIKRYIARQLYRALTAALAT